MASASSSGQPDRKSALLRQLTGITDSDSNSNIIDSGRLISLDVDDDRNVLIKLRAKSAKSLVADEIKKRCLLQASLVEGVKDIVVEIVGDSAPASLSSSLIGLGAVKEIIAVSSGKGGVGKSTVAVNLAYTLHQMGYKVGILDADIHGPSLPTMTRPAEQEVRSMTAGVGAGGGLKPATFEGVKLMSLGFLNPGAAIMRGPMVNQVLQQFLSGTEWGELDYLVLDMPPGTGDIPLTVAQATNISAAVIVTTPQKLSFVDVVKGIDLFDRVQVPCVAVVENMATLPVSCADLPEDFAGSVAAAVISHVQAQPSSFSQETVSQVVRNVLQPYWAVNTSQRRIFGSGSSQRLQEMWGFGSDRLFSLPILPEISQCGDNGLPFAIQYPQSLIAETFRILARAVIEEVGKVGMHATRQSNREKVVTFDSSTNYIRYGDDIYSTKDLRCACRCATCVEEFTGKKLLDDESVPEDIRPIKMSPIGRYAWAIDWSDGHKSLYPFKYIASLKTKANL
eukprot:gene8205-9052_t